MLSRTVGPHSILLVLCGQALFSVVESAPVQQMYSAVFQNAGGKLDEAKISEHVKFMHSIVDQDDSLTQEMKDRVEYAYGLLEDRNTAHCNVEYLDSVQRRFEQIQKPIEGNFKTLFGLVHRNLVKVCSAQHMGIAATLNKKFSENHDSDLYYLRKYYAEWQMRTIDNELLLKTIMDQLDKDRNDHLSEIKDAWDKSACMKVNSIMKQPKMKSFYDFAYLNSYFSVETAKNCPEEVRDWAINVPMCEALDKWMQETFKAARKHPLRWFELW